MKTNGAFGISWRNFKNRLCPKDLKDQQRINKELCAKIDFLQQEFTILANELARYKKSKGDPDRVSKEMERMIAEDNERANAEEKTAQAEEPKIYISKEESDKVTVNPQIRNAPNGYDYTRKAVTNAVSR